MKHLIRCFIICTLLTLIPALLPYSDCSARISLDISDDKPIVQDNADILDDYQEITIIDNATELYEKTGFVYIFITTDNTTDYKVSRELESIYNEHRSKLTGKGVVLLLISTDPDNMICELQAYQAADDMFPQTICNYIEEKMINDVADGEYMNAANTLLKELNRVYNGEVTTDSVSEDNVFADKVKSRIPAIILAVCISFIISSIIVLRISLASGKGSRRASSDANGYASYPIKKYDVYIRSIINSYDKKRKPS